MYYSAKYNSPVGTLTLASDGTALVGLWLEGQKYFGGSISQELTGKDKLPVFDEAAAWLDSYFAGERPGAVPPLAPVGTEYQRLVWELLGGIPYGQVTTYGRISEEAERRRGKASSSRAAGSAIGRNPISIIIPCHRVIGADGSLTGYAGGVERKLWLLEREGVDVSRFTVRGVRCEAHHDCTGPKCVDFRVLRIPCNENPEDQPKGSIPR